MNLNPGVLYCPIAYTFWIQAKGALLECLSAKLNSGGKFHLAFLNFYSVSERFLCS